MNYVIDYINYDSDDGNSGNNDVSNDGDKDDDEDYNDNHNNDDDNVDSFWKQNFNYHKLVICTCGAIVMIYYVNYVLKKLYMVSYSIGVITQNLNFFKNKK
jgi:hypothetical protein